MCLTIQPVSFYTQCMLYLHEIQNSRNLEIYFEILLKEFSSEGPLGFGHARLGLNGKATGYTYQYVIRAEF